MMGILNEEQIAKLLQEQVIGRLACQAEGNLYLVPVSYAYENDTIYMRSPEGKKTALMRKNPEVVFEVDDIADMANWRSVIVWGRYEELQGEERNKALQALRHRRLPLSASSLTRLNAIWPFGDEDDEEITGVIFRIAITQKTGRFELNSVESVI